jgi:hypothetical protein
MVGSQGARTHGSLAVATPSLLPELGACPPYPLPRRASLWASELELEGDAELAGGGAFRGLGASGWTGQVAEIEESERREEK